MSPSKMGTNYKEYAGPGGYWGKAFRHSYIYNLPLNPRCLIYRPVPVN